MESTERIDAMELRFDRALEAVRRMGEAVEDYNAAQEDLRVLSAYLGSDEWKADLAADEAGLLPANLKRGVLSEDGIWNLLEEWREIEKRMSELVENHQK
jgi:hypothetical protein